MSNTRRVMAIVFAAGFVGGFVLLPGTAIGAEVAEVEPNDAAGTATPLIYGDFGVGNIALGEFDYWVISNVGASDLIFVYVDTHLSTTGTDSRLNVYDNGAADLIEFDDSDGPGSGSVVAGALVATAGDLHYQVREDGFDSPITPYEIYQAVLSQLDTAAESEPNDTFGTATAITAGVMTADVDPVTYDYFSFEAAAGDSLVVIMDDEPNDDGILTDTDLAILDVDGATNLANGDDAGGRNGNAAGAVDAPAAGTYFVRVYDGGAGAGTNYRFTVLVNGVPVNGAGPLGACCFVDASCVPVLEEQCDVSGGDYQGWGSDCASTACPMPTGACCAADGSCTEKTEADCATAGGTYQGNTSTCVTHPCPQPTGACCAADGTCTENTEADCNTAGGTYQGDGAACDPNPCPQPVVACCFADGSCVEVPEADCNTAGGTPQGVGSTCATVTCDATGGDGGDGGDGSGDPPAGATGDDENCGAGAACAAPGGAVTMVMLATMGWMKATPRRRRRRDG